MIWLVIWLPIQPFLFGHNRRKTSVCLDNLFNCTMSKKIKSRYVFPFISFYVVSCCLSHQPIVLKALPCPKSKKWRIFPLYVWLASQWLPEPHVELFCVVVYGLFSPGRIQLLLDICCYRVVHTLQSVSWDWNVTSKACIDSIIIIQPYPSTCKVLLKVKVSLDTEFNTGLILHSCCICLFSSVIEQSFLCLEDEINPYSS